MSCFSCGFSWFYWDWYKDKTEMSAYVFWGITLPNGYAPKQLYVDKKYSSYKEEILNHLSRNQYIKCSNKTKQLITSIRVKELASNFKDGLFHYGIPAYSPITRDHIFSVILYCDLDQYSRKFSETFRRMNQYETMKSVKWRNSQYWWQAKSLIETVTLYGQPESGPFCMYFNICLFLLFYYTSLRLQPCMNNK